MVSVFHFYFLLFYFLSVFFNLFYARLLSFYYFAWCFQIPGIFFCIYLPTCFLTSFLSIFLTLHCLHFTSLHPFRSSPLVSVLTPFFPFLLSHVFYFVKRGWSLISTDRSYISLSVAVSKSYLSIGVPSPPRYHLGVIPWSERWSSRLYRLLFLERPGSWSSKTVLDSRLPCCLVFLFLPVCYMFQGS